MKKIVAFVFAGFVFAPFVCFASFNAIDQVNQYAHEIEGIPFAPITAGEPALQTFTVGLPGQLSRVDLALFRGSENSTITIDISKPEGTEPDFSEASVLARRTIDSMELPDYFELCFSNDTCSPEYTLSLDYSSDDLQVSPGETLAIIVRTTAIDFFHSWPGSYDDYLQGQSAIYVNQPYNNVFDTAFRTWVTIPEPGSLGLAMVAIFALARCRLHSPTPICSVLG